MSVSSVAMHAPDRRKMERPATTLRAKVFPGALDCLVKDFHRGGARLRFSGPTPADDRIIVVIWSTGMAVEAVRRWRAGAEAGFQFLHRFDLRGAVPESLAEAKRAWVGRREKLRRNKLKSCAVMIDYRGAPRAVRLS